MQVTVYGPLRSATGEKTVELDADPATVGEAIRAFLDAYPRAESQLLDDDGEVRASVRVLVDGTRRDPDDPLSDGEALTITPAVHGGCRPANDGRRVSDGPEGNGADESV